MFRRTPPNKNGILAINGHIFHYLSCILNTFYWINSHTCFLLDILKFFALFCDQETAKNADKIKERANEEKIAEATPPTYNWASSLAFIRKINLHKLCKFWNYYYSAQVKHWFCSFCTPLLSTLMTIPVFAMTQKLAEVLLIGFMSMNFRKSGVQHWKTLAEIQGLATGGIKP